MKMEPATSWTEWCPDIILSQQKKKIQDQVDLLLQTWFAYMLFKTTEMAQNTT